MVFFQTLKQRLYKKRLKQNICSDIINNRTCVLEEGAINE